jgi:PKD domain
MLTVSAGLRYLAACSLAVVLSACGSGGSVPTNVAPVASAGNAQNVFAGTQVTLNGSGSTDANAGPLTYAWTLTTKPPGSTAKLSSATAVKPVFTADLAGSYVFTLVVNNGKVPSAAATITVTAAVDAVAPVANAGAAQSVPTSAAVTLDGSASSDANRDTLTFAWKLTPPAGSAATLSNATSVSPQFTPDVAGSYVASLVVNDGHLSSAASAVIITAMAADVPPVANAGTAQSVTRNVTVTLNGSASSDSNGASLSYTWSFTSVPTGSTATLSATNVVSPTFTPNLTGVYVAQLIVNDGQLNSTPITVTITALPIVTSADLIINGSFEQGLASWQQGTYITPGGGGTCSYNATTAPGTETLTGATGFPATDGTMIALGSVASTAGGGPDISCTLYQTVQVPAGTTSLTLTFDRAATDASDSTCMNVGAFAAFTTDGSVPGLGNGTIVDGCVSPTGSPMQHVSLTLPSNALTATSLTIGLVNGADVAGHEVLGYDNVHLIDVSSN